MDSHFRRYHAGADRTSDRDPKTSPILRMPRSAVSLSNPGRVYRFVDPEAGDALIVVTAPPPVRGFIKQQDFVELSLLESIHGIAIHPNSDDITAEAVPDKIILGRPGGLTLSSADTSADRAPTALRPIFDVEEWRRNQQAGFIAREDALISAAAAAEPDRRIAGADRSCPLLSVARDVSGSQGRARSRVGGGQAGYGGSGCADRAFGRKHLDGASGAWAERSRQPCDRHQIRSAVVEGACRCPAGEVGGGAGKIQECRNRPSPRCRSTCSASC